MDIESIKKANGIKGKTVLLRTDFNVPIRKGRILDDYRIVSGLPSIRFLLRYKCRLILLTHLGQPEPGKYSDFSVEPVAKRLSRLIGKPVKFIPECIGAEVKEAVSKIKPGELVMLENVRFHPEEELNDAKFSRELASLADIYVNDAFAVSHRKHASVAGIKKYLPHFAGLLIEQEVKHMNRVLRPEKPMVVVFGGAKISTKLPLIKNLSKRSDRILIGGMLANNFLAALGFNVGKSKVDPDEIRIARKIYDRGKMILPVDAVVNSRANGQGRTEVKSINHIGPNDHILDIGPETIRLFAHNIKKAKTIAWNGPLGMFEHKSFKNGTLFIARAIASRSKGRAYGLVGGGETVEALEMTQMEDYVDWISTAGGAMLAYLGGEKMPGLEDLIIA